MAASIVRTSPTKKAQLAEFILEPSHSVSSNDIEVQSPYCEPPEVYLDNLSRKQAELSTIIQNVPPSRSPSPVQAEASKHRVDVLKTRVKKAFEYANGDPADGKWSAVVQLLHLRSSMGGVRWIGSSAEAGITESRIRWANAEIEAERQQLELQQAEAERVRKKVENWKETLDEEEQPKDKQPEQPPLPTPSASQRDVTETAKSTPVTVRSGGLKNSKLSFPVVKRSSLATVGKPKATPPPPSSPPPDPEISQPKLPKQAPDPPPVQPHRSIDELSESSFLPPSFPVNLATSTPNHAEGKKRKPEIIPPIADPLPAILEKQLPSPPAASTSAEGPSLLTPSKPRGPVPGSPQKRARSVTPGNPVKRLRSIDLAEVEETANVADLLQQETPRHRPLPTLTDLLASSRKSQKGKGKARDATPPSPAPQHDNNDISSSPLRAEKSASPMFPPLDALPQSTQQYPVSAMPSFYGGAVSPTKSLSSLAASDSEDEDEGGDQPGGQNSFHDSIEFEPPFFSTQHEDVALAKAGINDGSQAFMGYNSQYNVNDRIDEVAKFMEDDVDYDKWMKYPEDHSNDEDS